MRSLHEVVAELERRIPLNLAESWDKVGLLVAPGAPLSAAGLERSVERALLTIDLTEDVLLEAIERRAELLIAYHPPIFRPLERLDGRSALGRTLLELVKRGIAVWSPHTALDAVVGGVNDWLADGLGEGTRTPILPSQERGEFKLVVFVPHEAADALRDSLAALGAGVIGNYSHCSFNLEGRGTFLGGEGANPAVGRKGRLEIVDEVRLEMVCPGRLLPAVAELLRREHPYEEPAWEVYPLERRPLPGAGMGRLATLAQPVELSELVERIKSHLGLGRVRLARPTEGRGPEAIRTVALCAGAGGSVFERVPHADLYLTGEMRHHDVLARTQQGSAVVLCEHTHTERGFLPHLAGQVAQWVPGLECRVARSDHEPLAFV